MGNVVESVWPAIDKVRFEHPTVAAAAVVGTPDEVRGDRVEAPVVPVDATAIGPGTVKAHALENRAPYNSRGVKIVDELARDDGAGQDLRTRERARAPRGARAPDLLSLRRSGTATGKAPGRPPTP